MKGERKIRMDLKILFKKPLSIISRIDKKEKKGWGKEGIGGRSEVGNNRGYA